MNVGSSIQLGRGSGLRKVGVGGGGEGESKLSSRSIAASSLQCTKIDIYLSCPCWVTVPRKATN